MGKRKKVFRGAYDDKQSSYFFRYDPSSLREPYNNNFAWESGAFTSVNTPGFKNLKKRDLPQHPHFAEVLHIHYNPSRYIERAPFDPQYDKIYVNPKREPSNGFALIPFLDRSVTDDLDNQVRLKIKNKKVDLAVMGGEMKQTASFLDKRVGGVIRLLNKQVLGQTISRVVSNRSLYFRKEPLASSRRSASFKVTQVPFKRDIRTKEWVKNPYYTDSQHVRIVDKLSDSWLEYSYALRPLINDIYGAAEAIANVPYAVPLGVAKASLSVSRAYRATQDSGLQDPWVAEGRHSVRRTLGVRFQKENPLSAIAALGLTNPASLAWELVTLSFVIDWFYPLGKTLDSLDATLGTTFVDGFNVYDEEVHAEATLISNAAFYEAAFFNKYTRYRYQRTVLSDFPGVSMPSLRWPASLTQAASGVALLNQLFLKR